MVRNDREDARRQYGDCADVHEPPSDKRDHLFVEISYYRMMRIREPHVRNTNVDIRGLPFAQLCQVYLQQSGESLLQGRTRGLLRHR